MNMFLSEAPQPKDGGELIEYWRKMTLMLEPAEPMPPIPRSGMLMALTWIDERSGIIDDLREKISVLEAALAAAQAKRGPGRPKKDEMDHEDHA